MNDNLVYTLIKNYMYTRLCKYFMECDNGLNKDFYI